MFRPFVLVLLAAIHVFPLAPKAAASDSSSNIHYAFELKKEGSFLYCETFGVWIGKEGTYAISKSSRELVLEARENGIPTMKLSDNCNENDIKLVIAASNLRVLDLSNGDVDRARRLIENESERRAAYNGPLKDKMAYLINQLGLGSSGELVVCSDESAVFYARSALGGVFGSSTSFYYNVEDVTEAKEAAEDLNITVTIVGQENCPR